MEATKKLAKIIDALFTHTEYSKESVDELQEVFMEGLHTLFNLAFDLNLNIKELKKFTRVYGSKPPLTKLARFLGYTLQDEKTYVLLNYFLANYIKHYLSSVHEIYLNQVTAIMENEGITRETVQMIEKQYHLLVVNRHTLFNQNDAQ